MDDSIVTSVIIPLCLAITMFGIGLGLVVNDFKMLLQQPRPVFAGLAAQIIYLPLTGILIGLVLFDFPSPLIGAGFVIISLAPGSSTSNLFTLFSKGDLALSVSLTAISSLLAPFWLPFAASILLANIEATQHIELDVAKVFVELFSVTIIPIILGMLIRYRNRALAERLQKPVARFALIFLMLIILALIAKYRHILHDYTLTIAPAILLLSILAYGGGYVIARLAASNAAQVRSISMEVGIQNAALALLVTANILKIPEMTLPAMFYGLAMYIVGFTAVILFNRNSHA